MPLIPNDDPEGLAELLGYLGEIGYGELYLRPVPEARAGGGPGATGAISASGAGGAGDATSVSGTGGVAGAASEGEKLGMVVPAAGGGGDAVVKAIDALAAAVRQAGGGAGAVAGGGASAGALAGDGNDAGVMAGGDGGAGAADDPAARAAALAALAEVVTGCRRCRLCEGRQKTVFGSGNPSADLMFIGEGPGAEEDRQGLPFVGRAGELLTRIIAAIGMIRDQVYIANIVKCRPPGNRDPQPDEVAACRSYLERQIALIRPRLIVALGRIAAQTLLGNDLPIGRMRGQWFQVLGVPVMVTYHPAALLRNPALKRPTWEDMQEVRDRLRGGG
jgi:uracil-DNA glycosylase family 4